MFFRRCAPGRVKKIRDNLFSDLRKKEEGLLPDMYQKEMIATITALMHNEQYCLSFIAIKVKVRHRSDCRHRSSTIPAEESVHRCASGSTLTG
ncbi:TPA: hypothetical protein ACIBFG_002343 [Salmonella enterica subsp. enterica serovar Bahrenfeld]|nr:hypothetical protein [Salmonella enterica]HAR9008401.1 hypothetical protein [Salmonella enterica]HAR9317406.1 hypothetical protein [Salmonella enterica]